tara:strand:- start:126 stop:311 length:186 start_codon:yes stop_codon:yes gene_type:complete
MSAREISTVGRVGEFSHPRRRGARSSKGAVFVVVVVFVFVFVSIVVFFVERWKEPMKALRR